jgi:ADP-ribosyl-[dinitrogen reductase] hydrolase
VEKYLKLEKKEKSFSRIEIPGYNSSLFLAAFPGRTSANTFSVEKMVSVFDALEREKCSHFLSLVEDDEFNRYCAKTVLEKEAKKRLINWVHLPVADMDVPKNNTLVGLNELRPTLFDAIKKDHSVAIHCMGGLGRSGTVAAIILADVGVSMRKAIELVRRFRPGAIETKEQENYLLISSQGSENLSFAEHENSSPI